MSSAISLEDLQEFSRNIMRKEGFEKFDLNVEGETDKGENYLGEVTFFTLRPEASDKIYNLVMKTANRSQEIRENIPVESAYGRELYVYCEIFPTFRKFLKEFNVSEEILDYVPTIYWICNEENRETLIMENMTMKGFKILDRMQPLDIDQAGSVVEILGKHHAFSLAMQKLRPSLFGSLTRNLDNVQEKIFQNLNLNEYLIALFKNVMKLMEENGKIDLVRKFENIEDDIKSIFDETLSKPLVICHGDCWINNIMFKSKINSSKSEICFVDFQLSSLDSPIKDLSYFIYTACDKKGLDKLDILLDKYYSSLSKTLDFFGLKSDEFFTLQNLKEQWKREGKFGLIMSLMLIQFELFHEDEAPDVSQKGFDMMSVLNIKMKNEKVYRERVIDVYTHFGEMFL